MTVVFFCPNILRDAHRYIFDLDHLQEDGYKLVMLDATKFYGNMAVPTEKIILENRVECNTMEDFVAFKENLPDEPVIFVAFDNYMNFAAPIFHLIIRKEDVLLSYHTKRSSSVDLPKNKMRLYLNRIIIKLNRFLPLHNFKFFYKWKYKLYIPDYFLCSTEFLIPTKTYLSVKRRNRMTVHADDINQLMGKEKNIIDKSKKVGVFLDQGIPFIKLTHVLLFKNQGPIPDDYLETYFDNLEKSLHEIKEKMGLDEIVISLHPVALKFEEELKGKFRGFKTYMGVTKDLVRDSALVLSHFSTAINFAIFYKKPVIVFSDDFLMTYHPMLRNNILFFEEELDMTRVEMGTDKENLPTRVNVNMEKYTYFTRKYLKDNNIQENSYYYAINNIKKDLQSR